MALTCTRCLAGDQHRCLRGDCANFKANGPAVTRPRVARASRAGRYVSNGRPRGRSPRRVSVDQERHIACLLAVGNGYSTIYQRTDYPLGSIQRVRAELVELAEAGIDAGPVVAEKFEIRRPRKKYGIRTDPETQHKAALLLVEGGTLERTAELAGITVSQARTVRTNLRVLDGQRVRWGRSRAWTDGSE